MKLTDRTRTWIMAALSVVIVAYFVVSWIYTSSTAANRVCEGVLVSVHDTSEIHFVTPEDLAGELGELPKNARYTRLRDIDIDSIERMLSVFDKIEHVNVNLLSSGKILIDVWPMRPIARIFDSAGHSYYINRSGKRIAANHRYFLDVPIIYGDFSASFPATSLIPLLDYIESDPDWNEAVAMIEVRSPNDIIVVPAIRGHVINLGDTLNLPDKFRRVKLMYSKVMASKGWDYYKEISVKWGGQIVGVKRESSGPAPEYILSESNDEEASITSAELDNTDHLAASAEEPIPRNTPQPPSTAEAKPKAKAKEPDKTAEKAVEKPKPKPSDTKSPDGKSSKPAADKKTSDKKKQ